MAVDRIQELPARDVSQATQGEADVLHGQVGNALACRICSKKGKIVFSRISSYVGYAPSSGWPAGLLRWRGKINHQSFLFPSDSHAALPSVVLLPALLAPMLLLLARSRRARRCCRVSLGKRIKAALLCKTLPKDDNPAEYVNGSSNAPSRNLVTAIKLAGYVVHCGTGGKVSAVDGDGREVR